MFFPKLSNDFSESIFHHKCVVTYECCKDRCAICFLYVRTKQAVAGEVLLSLLLQDIVKI